LPQRAQHAGNGREVGVLRVEWTQKRSASDLAEGWQILQTQHRGRPDELEQQKLVMQTGTFLNGYVSCKVKRWLTFHKFLVKHFLGYITKTQKAADGSKDVPPLPQSPSAAAEDVPEGQGIKKNGGEVEEGSVRGFTMQKAVEAMPVATFLHVVGCGQQLPGLEELVLNDTLVGDCPPDVRQLLFRQNNMRCGVRHRIRETMEALATIGVISTVFSDNPAGAEGGAAEGVAGTSDIGGGGLDGGSGGRDEDATVRIATSILVQRNLSVVIDDQGGRKTQESFVFEREEDIDKFWRTLAIRARNYMQINRIKPEGDDYESDDAPDGQGYDRLAQRGRGEKLQETLLQRFPLLKKRKTWSNLAFGDCTATQRDAVTALLKRERMAANDQVTRLSLIVVTGRKAPPPPRVRARGGGAL